MTEALKSILAGILAPDKWRIRLRSLAAMRNSVAWWLLGGILLFSAFITLILSAFQLYLGYRSDVAALDSQLGQIRSSYSDSLAQSLWTLDREQLQLQLSGILRLPYISAVEVRDVVDQQDSFVVEAGKRSSGSSVIVRDYPLHYHVQGQDRVIGTFHIEATLVPTFRALLHRALIILANEATATFLVSIFIIYIFHYLITRHLFAIARFVGNYKIATPPSHLRLRRRPHQREDELDRVVTAFNALSDDLQMAYRKLRDASDQLALDAAVLRERDAAIRSLVDSNIIGVFIGDFEGRIFEANDAFLRIVGYEREDLIAGRLNWLELTPADWHERDAQWIEEHKRTGVRQPIEKEYLRKDGSRVPILLGASTFEGSENRGAAFVLDLTERKRAEQRLMAQHAVAQILAEAATIEEAAPRILRALCEHLEWDIGSLWRMDPEARVLRCADLWRVEYVEAVQFEAATRASTFRPGSALPGRVWESRTPAFIPDVTQDPTYLRASAAAREGLRAAFAFPIVLGGQVLGVMDFVGREIRRLDQAMLDTTAAIGSQIGQFIERRRAEYLVEQVFESSPDSVSIVGMDYRFRRVNPGYEANYKIPANRMLGSHIADLVGSDVFERMIKPKLDLCFAGKEVRYTEWFPTPGGRRYMLISYTPLLKDPEHPAALVINRDLTDQILASEALRESQRELAHANRLATMGQLTATIAHEVNQPIATAVTNAQAALRFLAGRPPDLEEVREALGEIVKAGNRASAVISRIRAMLRKAPPKHDGVDLNTAIRDVVELTRHEAMKSRVSVQMRLMDGLPVVRGDRVQLQQVILNLVMNAIEAMSQTSERPRNLLITTQREESGDVLVGVLDSGPGLTPAALERLFEAFYTTKRDGMGLGLSICRSIIEAHGGRVWATNNVIPGAVFQFTVPTERRDS